MNPYLRDIYPALLLEHARRPRNRWIPAQATHRGSGDIPLCGDRLTVHLRVEAGLIRDIGFDGVCCAVATASASLMTQALIGREIAHAERIRDAFMELIADGRTAAPDLGDLGIFAAVHSVRSRERCATLAWQALAGALRPVQ